MTKPEWRLTDAVLRTDYDSIKEDDWLTDNVRATYFLQCSYANLPRQSHSGKSMYRSLVSRIYFSYICRYLEREELIAYPKASIVLLRPSMSTMLMHTPDPLTLKEVLPNFSSTTHIFLPINDNRDVEAEDGGTHWSLLLVSVIDGVSFHYDSMDHHNNAEAQATTMKLERLLGKRLKYIAMSGSPQQNNTVDCGVFVCIAMRHLLLKRLLRADASKKISMGMSDTSIHAKEGRKIMIKVVEEKRREGVRRNS